MSHREQGMFPAPKEIKMECSCPDWAGLCKHLAAVLYGVGSRLDAQPELLFTLRQVDPAELIAQATQALGTTPAARGEQLRGDELSEVFGIDLVEGAEPGAAAHKGPPADASPVKVVRRVVRKAAALRGKAKGGKRRARTAITV
jgi:hypothetical protein